MIILPAAQALGINTLPLNWLDPPVLNRSSSFAITPEVGLPLTFVNLKIWINHMESCPNSNVIWSAVRAKAEAANDESEKFTMEQPAFASPFGTCLNNLDRSRNQPSCLTNRNGR